MTAGGWRDSNTHCRGRSRALDADPFAQSRQSLDVAREAGKVAGCLPLGTRAEKCAAVIETTHGGQAHSRCCGKLTFIRRPASLIGWASAWPLRRRNWDRARVASHGRSRLSDRRGHQPTTSRTIGARTPRRSRCRTDRRRAGRRRCAAHIARRKWEARARAPQAGRDGPGGAEHAHGDRRFRDPGDAVRTLRKYWIGGLVG